MSVAAGTQGKPDHSWDAEFDCAEGRLQEPLSDRGDHYCDKYVHSDLLELR